MNPIAPEIIFWKGCVIVHLHIPCLSLLNTGRLASRIKKKTEIDEAKKETTGVSIKEVGRRSRAQI